MDSFLFFPCEETITNLKQALGKPSVLLYPWLCITVVFLTDFQYEEQDGFPAS